MTKLPPLPMSAKFLQRYSVECRRRARTLTGGVRMKHRRGQSLLFHEYRDYVLGDDIRHVDWRASARQADPNRRLLRTFQSEERSRFLFSIDDRETMRWPQNWGKLVLSLWLTQALAAIFSSNQDEVVLHRLFGNEDPVRCRGTATSGTAENFCQDIIQTSEPEQRLNDSNILHYTAPTGGSLAVWVISTDLTFDDPQQQLAKLIDQAQAQFCWVVLIDMNSWPSEKEILAEGPLDIIGPGISQGEKIRFEPLRTQLNEIEKRIYNHKDALLKDVQLGENEKKPWDLNSHHLANLEDTFHDEFINSLAIQQLLVQST